MHSRLNWWTEQSIEWFARASQRTDYHSLLCDAIEQHLGSCQTILELGCGLGYESEILSQRGYRVDAYDIDANVIGLARARTGLDIFHQANSDYVDAYADAVLCINYGHITAVGQLERLLSHARRRLIYVASRHSGHGTDTRDDRTQEIREVLTKGGKDFTEKSLALDFDQPLLSMDEARAFIEWTYLGKNTDRYMSFVERTDDKTFPYVFRNRKEIILFSIEKRSDS